MRHEQHATDAVPDGRGLRLALVVSRFNHRIAERLQAGAEEALRAAGVLAHGVERFSVPGAFELPLAAKLAASTERFDAVVCLGCIIRGETPHFDYISAAVAHGLMAAGLETGVHAAFGVLTTETLEQADARCRPGPSNKGYEAACAALEMARLRRQLHDIQRAAPRG